MWQKFEQQPADMGVEKTFGDIVRIFVVIDMFMMSAMFAGPHKHRILERSSAEDEYEQAHWESRLEGHVRKETVITERDAEARRGQHHCENG